jgi:SAM-dependent methyltransferase
MGARPARRLFRTSPGAVFVLLFAVAAGQEQINSLADCEKAYPASMGRAGKDVVWVPTPDAVVHGMLAMAKVTPQDLVVDLGAGDGRIAIAAAKEFGASALGIEYDPDMARLAGCRVQAEGVAGKARIIEGDIFKEDYNRASVVTMYLLPDLNVCIRHRILAMAPGTRVASHQFTMGEWEADASAEIDRRNVYLWLVPAHVDGVWDFRDRHGAQFTIDLSQTFGKISGEIVRDGARQALVTAMLRGTDLRFTFDDTRGATLSFAGTVRGTEIEGILRTAGGDEVEARGSLHGALRPAPWAEMPAHCSRYYDR